MPMIHAVRLTVDRAVVGPVDFLQWLFLKKRPDRNNLTCRIEYF